MKIEKKQISMILLALYLLGLVFSWYALFNLQEELIYDLNVLAISDLDVAEPAFNKTFIIVILSLILGLFAIYYSIKNNDAAVIYVEKTAEEKRKEEEKADTEARKDDKLKVADSTRLKNKNDLTPGTLNKILSQLCRDLEASQGAVYLKEEKEGKRMVTLKASYAMSVAESQTIGFEFGEGLVGQVAKEKKTIYLQEVPKGFVKIVSGLGESAPSYLLIVPIIAEEELQGVVEIASFVPFRKNDIDTLEKFFSSFGKSSEASSKKATKDEPAVMETPEAPTNTVKKSKKKKSEDI